MHREDHQRNSARPLSHQQEGLEQPSRERHRQKPQQQEWQRPQRQRREPAHVDDTRLDAVILDQRALWFFLLITLVIKGAGPLSLDRLLTRPRPAQA